jgi:hypothetical protein
MSTITYTVTEGTTQRGQHKHISSDGFTYVLKVYFELKKYSDDIHGILLMCTVLWSAEWILMDNRVLSATGVSGKIWFTVSEWQGFWSLETSDGFTYVLKVYFELKKYSDDIHKWNIDVLSFYVVHSLLFYSSAVVSSMCLRHTLNWSKFGFCCKALSLADFGITC